MRRLFPLAVFVSAVLLFSVQPLAGKLLLPLAGGTPAVWNTCMLFFQAALLAGYAYAHLGPTLLGTRWHALAHVAVLALPLLVLPFAVDRSVRIPADAPALALLKLLTVTVGLPFFVLATSAPLLQRWFAVIAPGRDPYPLYAASNAGSLLALLAYPVLLEPMLALGEQCRTWALGYGGFAALVGVCALVVARMAPNSAPRQVHRTTVDRDPVGRWILLSFAPSSLLLGCTTYLSTDIAPVPLLWVLPLALYLLTFIIAFSGRPIVSPAIVRRILPMAALAFFFALLGGATEPWGAVGGIHLFAFFVAALACHGELARLKPPPERLTQFYLWMSFGGVLGGIVNGLIAPILFTKVGLAEYPLALALACGLMPAPPRSKALEGIPESTGMAALTYPLMVAVITIGLFLTGRVVGWKGPILAGILFGMPLVLIFPLVDKPLRYAAGLVAVWLCSFLYNGEGGARLYFERNFFGTVKVTAEPDGKAHRLVHGSTIHGRQFWTDGKPDREPLSYYGREGPIGNVFATRTDLRSVAVCGLGAGSLAAYAKPGVDWTFYEIDPAMVRIASDRSLFTYLHDNFPDKARLNIVLGDARIEMAAAADGGFGLIVLDAFSSDAIPVHLLTREAIEMYRRKLAPGGLIAFHVSNRYLDLEPVLSAAAASLGMVAWSRTESPSTVPVETGRLGSIWVVLAADVRDLGDLRRFNDWSVVPPAKAGFRVWTDDYSNLLGVFQWTAGKSTESR